jgi:hypothetical protein
MMLRPNWCAVESGDVAQHGFVPRVDQRPFRGRARGPLTSPQTVGEPSQLSATLRRWGRVVLESFAKTPADIGGATIPGWHMRGQDHPDGDRDRAIVKRDRTLSGD